jgi:transposase-like protein
VVTLTGKSLNANQLFQWRKLYHASLLGTSSGEDSAAVHLLPIAIVDDLTHEQSRELIIS